MIRLNLFMIWFLHFISLLSVICRCYRQNSSSRIIVVLVYTVSTLFRMYQIVSIKKLPYWSLWILNNSNVKTEETIMSELSKILATIGVVVLFVIIFGAIAGSKSDAGQTPGILGLIVFGALIGALRAIWKKPNNK